MKNTITLIFAVIAALLWLRLCSGPSVVVREVVRADTVTVVRVDTVVVEKPVPVRIVERRTDTLLFERAGDTVFMPVPIRQYQFRDSLYALDVTGYSVSLERLEVYPKTVYRTISQTTERTVKNKRRWGLGIQAGYGYNFGANKPGLYVGIGMQYSVVKW